MADKAHIQTDILLSEIEKRLSAIYKTATEEIQAKADTYFQKFKKQDEAQRQLVDKGEISQEEYISWRKNKIMQGEDWKKIRSQLVLEYENINKTALAYINDKLPEIYALNYNAFEDVANGIKGYSFTLLDQNTIKNLALNDKSLLPAKIVNTRRYERWCTQKINAQILQGVLQGESMPKMAKRLQRVSEMDKNSAIRNARTMTTSAENKGRIDSYKKAQEDGIVLQKEWIATFDGRTRHSHAMVDGELREQEELFSNGLLYPGDPNGASEEVYNCRCSLGSKVIGFDARLFAERLDREDRQNVSEWRKENEDSLINSLTNANASGKIDMDNLVKIPQIPSSTISKKIESGEYGTKLNDNQYNKHKKGTPQYNAYLNSRRKKGGNPQSILTISREEAQQIILDKAGTGIVKVDRKGNPLPKEKISCDKVIGEYYGGGKYHKTNKAVIHYSKKGAHIVPIKGNDYD